MKSKDIKVGEEYGIAHSSVESRYVRIADAQRVRVVEYLGNGRFRVATVDGSTIYGSHKFGNDVVRAAQFWGTWERVEERQEANALRRKRDAAERAELDAEIASFLPDGFTIAFHPKDYEKRALRDALEAAYEYGRASGIESESMRQ
jgi:hypothetical protein